MRLVKCVVVLVTLVAAGMSQTTPEQPVNLDQAVDRVIAREKAVVDSLRDYSPLAETYVQEMKHDPELGSVPEQDFYFLSRVRFNRGVDDISMLEKQAGLLHKVAATVTANPFKMGYNGVGFLQGAVVDSEGFDRRNYEFNYIRREFLGDVRCLVFDVSPKKGSGAGRFIGRIWVEDQGYNVVRLSGVRVKAARFHYYFHFDSWRLSMGPNSVWLPAYIYTEETDVKYSVFKHEQLKAQTRLWGYDLKNPHHTDEYSNIIVDSKSVDDKSEAARDKSPIEAQRAFQQQAEDNVVDKLTRAGLLAPAGNFEKVLDTVVNNLIVTNNLDLYADVHCRVLLTSPLESLTLGHTIVISRGLIDVLPDEGALAMILAHELGHIALGHKLDTRYAFSDRVIFADEQALQHFRFVRDPAEEAAADKKAIELLKNSPYAGKLSEGGLFLRALSARSKQLPNLVSAHLGNRLAMSDQAMRMQAIANAAPALDMNKKDQIAALPLGGRLKLDPWSDRVEMMKTKPVAGMTARDKMPFEVTPFMPYLTRQPASQPVNQPATASTAQVTETPAAAQTGSH